MCVVIDTCVFHRVFNPEDGAFSPVAQWLRGKGKMVIGGSTYEEQLRKMRRYLPLVAELRRSGKVVIIDKDRVDEREREIRAMEPNADFDDPHLIAIVCTSRCKVVCTLDARADRYLLQARFYPNGGKPKIYRQKSHKHLLCDANVVGACAG